MAVTVTSRTPISTSHQPTAAPTATTEAARATQSGHQLCGLKKPISPAGEQQVEAGEQRQADGERERRGAGRVVGHVPVDDVSAAEEDAAAQEEPAFDLHMRYTPLLLSSADRRDVLLDATGRRACHDVRVVRLERRAF
jgi:hypothetical protein